MRMFAEGPHSFGKRPILGAVALVLAALIGGLTTPAAGQDRTRIPTDPADPLLNQGPKAEAIGEHGMVSTQLASSTLAAVDVLKAGGNAIDAALTALFVQQIHDYHMVFLFGSMSALYYDAATNKVYAINANGGWPRPDRGERGDASIVTIGGTVKGSAALATRFGTWPWARLIQPAIDAAEEGAVVTSFMYGLSFALWESGYLGDLRKHQEAREFYMPDGHLVGVGHRWKMPALAKTLREIAADPDYMYTGAWGKKFVKAATKAGGRITMDDMAEYSVQWSEPVRTTYRGREIYGSPPPDDGGVIIAYNLNVLENFDLRASGHYSESAKTLELMSRTFGRVQSEVSVAPSTAGRQPTMFIRDPLDYNVPTDVWLSKEYGRLVARIVEGTTPKVDVTPPAEDAAASGSGGIAASGIQWGQELGSDHIVVADAQGNWVTMLHTIHGGAPGVFIDGVRATGTGRKNGVTMGPGRHISLPISAIMIMGSDGRPWLAMGTPGNPPQPVTEVLSNIIDFGMNPKAAAEAPRFWGREGGEDLHLESRIADDVRKTLRRRGITITDLGPYNFHTGSMQIVWRSTETGRLHGVTDPRRLGYAAGH